MQALAFAAPDRAAAAAALALAPEDDGRLVLPAAETRGLRIEIVQPQAPAAAL